MWPFCWARRGFGCIGSTIFGLDWMCESFVVLRFDSYRGLASFSRVWIWVDVARGFYICGGSSWGNLQVTIVALFQARCIFLESLSFEGRGWYLMWVGLVERWEVAHLRHPGTGAQYTGSVLSNLLSLHFLILDRATWAFSGRKSIWNDYLVFAFLFVSVLSVRASLEIDWFGKVIRVVGPNYDVCFGEDRAGISLDETSLFFTIWHKKNGAGSRYI